ncbi:MAG: leucine-rich repeat domain-containing protein [Coriobacteriales bacterium]|jgi:hypothetical protein|nr:leucine-rich repeat domain-containing protein [Coriobacteriales bacterium]
MRTATALRRSNGKNATPSFLKKSLRLLLVWVLVCTTATSGFSVQAFADEAQPAAASDAAAAEAAPPSDTGGTSASAPDGANQGAEAGGETPAPEGEPVAPAPDSTDADTGDTGATGAAAEADSGTEASTPEQPDAPANGVETTELQDAAEEGSLSPMSLTPFSNGMTAEEATAAGWAWTESAGNLTITKYSGSYKGTLEAPLTIPESIDGKPVVAVASSSLGSGSGIVALRVPSSITTIKEYAFDGNSTLKSVVLEEGVKTLGEAAFYNNKSMTTITLPNSVTTLGSSGPFPYGVFEGCTALTTVSLGSGISEITPYLFYQCSALTTIDASRVTALTKIGSNALPANLTTVDISSLASIPNNFLSGRSKVTSVTLPGTAFTVGSAAFKGTGLSSPDLSHATAIGANAFENCAALGSVSLPAGSYSLGAAAFKGSGITAANLATLSEIPANVFENCTKLTSVTLPSSGYTIGAAAFKGTALASLDLSQATAIGTNAFENCTKLGTVTLPDAAVLPGSVFKGCTVLEAINLATVASIGANAFENCTKLSTVTWPSGNYSLGVAAFKGSGLTTANVANLSEIPANVFENCTKLTSVTLPSTGYTIGAAAFKGSALQAANISKATAIGDGAFEGCTKLGNVALPPALALPGSAFKGCTSLEAINLATTPAIGASAFENCTKLSTVTWPTGSYAIEAAAFKNTGLLSVAPGAVNALGAGAFANCTKLLSADLSDATLTALEQDSFSGCFVLATVQLPATLAEIKASAFANASLTALQLPASLTTIRSAAFSAVRADQVALPAALTVLEKGAFNVSGVSSIDLSGTAISQIPAEAYANVSALTAIKLPATLQSIGANAFSGTGISAISLPSQLQSIGQQAFAATALTQVVIPHSVNSMGAAVFQDCTALAQVTFFNGMTAVPESCFKGCTALTGFVAGTGVSSIGAYAFADCTGITGTLISSLPAQVESIGSSAFSGCTGITALSLPATIKQVEANAFANCTELASLTVNSLDTQLAAFAFHDCTKLASVALPEGYTYLSTVFEGCTSLTPEGISNGQARSPYEVSGAEATAAGWVWTGTDALTITGFNTTVNSQPTFKGTLDLPVYVPASIDGVSVATLGTGASILRNSGIVNLSVPGGVAVGYQLFYYGSSLQKLTLEAGVSSIGARAFHSNSNLKEVVILSSDLTVLPEAVFYNCGALEQVTLPASGLVSIGTNAFQGCGKLQSFQYPTTLKSIANGAFQNCRALGGEIVFPEGVELIGAPFGGAFQNPANPASVTIPAEWTSVPKSFFSGCTALTKVVFPESSAVTSIGDYAFSGCTGLTEVTFAQPSAVVSIGNAAFKGCSFVGIEIPSSVTSIGHAAFANNPRLKAIDIPDAVTSIAVDMISNGEGLFSNCPALETVVFGTGVTSIYVDDNFAFNGGLFLNDVSLTSVTFEGAITALPGKAFQNCTALENIVLPDSLQKIGGDAFLGATSLRSLIMPDSLTSVLGGSNFEGEGFLANNQRLETLEIGSGLSSLPRRFMVDYPADALLDSVLVPDNINTVESNAFKNVHSLTQLAFEYGVTTLNANSINNCTGLLDLYLPRSINTEASAGFMSSVNAGMTFYIPPSDGDWSNANLKALIQSLPNFAESGATIVETTQTPSEVVILNSDDGKVSLAFRGQMFSPSDQLSYAPVPSGELAAIAQTLKSGYRSELLASYVVKITDNQGQPVRNATSRNVSLMIQTVAGNPDKGAVYVIHYDPAGKKLSIPYCNIVDGSYRLSAVNPDGYYLIAQAEPNPDPQFLEINEHGGVVRYNIGTGPGTPAGKATSLVLPGNVTSIGNGGSITDHSGYAAIANYGFYGNGTLSYLWMPDGVTSIGTKAFQQATAITEIRLPASLQHIYKDAFSRTGRLNTLYVNPADAQASTAVFPEGLISIDDFAFSYSGVNNYILPASLQSVGSYTFHNSAVQTAVFQGSGVKVMGQSIFSGSSLSQITLPSALERIEKEAFANTRLDEIDLPDTLNFIADDAFKDSANTITAICSYGSYAYDYALQHGWPIKLRDMPVVDGVLTTYTGTQPSIDLPAFLGIDTVGSAAFKNNATLASIVLPEGVTSIGSGAFAGCSALESITLPSTLGSLDITAFADLTYGNITLKGNYSAAIVTFARTHGFKLDVDAEFTINNDGVVTAYSGMGNVVAIPEGVAGIAAGAFDDTVETLTIPASVSSIAEGAIPTSVTLIRTNWGSAAYQYALDHNITVVTTDFDIDANNILLGYKASDPYVTIPAGVTAINPLAFHGDTQIIKVVVPEGVTALPYSLFADLPYLNSVVLPQTLTSIGDTTFANSRALKVIELPAALQSIGDGAFSNSFISTITLPEALESIGASAFANSRIQTVDFNEGLQSIGANAFANTSLQSALLPETLTSLGDGAFRGCKALTAVSLPGGIGTVPNAVFLGSGLSEVSLGEGITSIGDQAFWGANRLSRVWLPSTVTSIGSQAFYNATLLQEIYIPKSVNAIAPDAFSGTLPSLTYYVDAGSYAQNTLRNLGPDILFNTYSTSTDGSARILFAKDALPDRTSVSFAKTISAAEQAGLNAALAALESETQLYAVSAVVGKLSLSDSGSPVVPEIPLTAWLKAEVPAEAKLYLYDPQDGGLTEITSYTSVTEGGLATFSTNIETLATGYLSFTTDLGGAASGVLFILNVSDKPIDDGEDKDEEDGEEEEGTQDDEDTNDGEDTGGDDTNDGEDTGGDDTDTKTGTSGGEGNNSNGGSNGRPWSGPSGRPGTAPPANTTTASQQSSTAEGTQDGDISIAEGDTAASSGTAGGAGNTRIEESETPTAAPAISEQKDDGIWFWLLGGAGAALPLLALAYWLLLARTRKVT